MKNIFLITFIISTTFLSAQIHGNGNLTTKIFPFSNIKNIEIEWYANFTIDCDKTGIEVTAESNIIDYINFEMSGNSLTVDQKKWIQANKEVTIIIGAKNLESVTLGSHEEINIVNVNSNKLSLEAELGTINVSGKTKFANLKSYSGKINASELLAQKADIIIFEDGEIIANVVEEAFCKINEDGLVNFTNKPLTCNNCPEETTKKIIDTKWIGVKIKNNSWGRKHFEVVGPKPRGGKFGYGFAMMPGQVKKERWTVGTKIYKKNRLGIRELLVTLTAEDKGQVVKLF